MANQTQGWTLSTDLSEVTGLLSVGGFFSAFASVIALFFTGVSAATILCCVVLFSFAVLAIISNISDRVLKYKSRELELKYKTKPEEE